MTLLTHPIFILSIALCIFAEYLFSRRKGIDNYIPWEAYTSLVIIFLDRIIGYFAERNVSTQAAWLWDHRWFDLSLGRNPVLTFFAVEFAYYWAHRYNHMTPIGWATHSIHHTPTRYNLTMGYRVGVTRVFSLSWAIFLPLMLLGFHPLDVTVVSSAIFVYQFFLHTELVPKLGFLESFVNTPSNHRVHHGSNPEFFDKNFGGFTLIFDRVFGTYLAEPEKGTLEYGLKEITARRSLRYEIVGIWRELFGRLSQTPNPLLWLKILFWPVKAAQPYKMAIQGPQVSKERFELFPPIRSRAPDNGPWIDPN